MPKQEYIEVDPDLLPDEGEALGPVNFEGEPARSTAELFMSVRAPQDAAKTKKHGGAMINCSLAV